MGQLLGIRRNEEIEPVHQARVASRRLRAALRMFADCFDAKKAGRWRKSIRKLTEELGAARDRDVQIEYVEGFLAGLDEKDRANRPGVKRLLLRLRQSRETLQPEVIRTLDKMEENGTLADMCGEVEKALFTLRSRDTSLWSPFVAKETSDHIRGRKEALLRCQCALDDPDDAPGHHAMRIATKKLRYTLEICNPVYDRQLATIIKAIKRAQSLLGDIHDCDVWVTDIDRHMEQERLATIAYFGHSRPFNRLQSGLRLVREDRIEHRQQVFAELLQYWKELDAEQIWSALEDVLESRMGAREASCPDVQETQTHDGKE